MRIRSHGINSKLEQEANWKQN